MTRLRKIIPIPSKYNTILGSGQPSSFSFGPPMEEVWVRLETGNKGNKPAQKHI